MIEGLRQNVFSHARGKVIDVGSHLKIDFSKLHI